MAAAEPLSEEKVMRIAEEVRETFIGRYSESGDFDPRDLQRVRDDIEYVAKFTRHQRGIHDNIINQMVECFKWRNSFKANDIQFEDIEEYLWQSGMAYNHGLDRLGNNIVILNIRLHRKDSKKALALQRWITFCFESHRRVYPKGKMCMIFDMTGSGLSQMDMELMRFIVNCFKTYFPDLLGLLLVYNMPWILQAAWKIVQSWLSDGAKSRVKFVNSETIREYVNGDQLLEQFGGTDPWQFDYVREKQVMQEQLQGAMDRDRNREEEEGEDEEDTVAYMQSIEVPSSDMEQNPSGDSLSSEGGDQLSRGGGGATREQRIPPTLENREQERKVRFSSTLPPSRQTRYGTEDEREMERRRMTSPENKQLLKGSAASTGFRRRQVNKLMTLQANQRGQGSPVTMETNRRHSEPAPMLTALPFSNILLSPVNELVFTGAKEKELLCTLSLTNISTTSPALFKIKTTAPRRYKVRPNLSLVKQKKTAKVQVLLVARSSSSSSSDTPISDDKFLVQIYSFQPSSSVPSPDQLSTFWKSLSDRDIIEHRMRCRWASEVISPLSPLVPPSSILTSTPLPQTPPTATPTSPPATRTQGELWSINDKLERLIKSNQKLQGKVVSLRRWFILLFLLLILTLFYNTFINHR